MQFSDLKEMVISLRKKYDGKPWSKEMLLDGTYFTSAECFVVDITPEIAKKWLTRNVKNRSLSCTNVERISESIKSSHWNYNGETIIFSDKGELRNGQNRLASCVNCGQTIRSAVIFGVPSDCFVTIDSGKPRNIADYVELLGEVNHKLMSAAAAWIWKMEKNPESMKVHSVRPQKYEIGELIDRHPKLQTSVRFTSSFKDHIKKMLPPSVIAFLHYQLTQIDRTDAETFFEKLKTGANLDEFHPLLKLRERLSYLHANYGKLNSCLYVGTSFKAWNFFRESKPIKRLEWKISDPMPIPQ